MITRNSVPSVLLGWPSTDHINQTTWAAEDVKRTSERPASSLELIFIPHTLLIIDDLGMRKLPHTAATQRLSTRQAGAVLGVSHAAVHRARLSQKPLKSPLENAQEFPAA